MRGENWILEAPPEYHAESQPSEREDALESQRLESLISVLRQKARRRDTASHSAGAFEPPRVWAAREILGEGMPSG